MYSVLMPFNLLTYIEYGSADGPCVSPKHQNQAFQEMIVFCKAFARWNIDNWTIVLYNSMNNGGQKKRSWLS